MNMGPKNRPVVESLYVNKETDIQIVNRRLEKFVQYDKKGRQVFPRCPCYV